MGGASYLRSLKAPFPHIKLIPTGGVTVATAADFLKAGAEALGVGSDLVNAKAIAEGKPWIVTDLAKAYLDIIGETRKPS
jgi:2-dehydro-3-deoxyphosphogluconate aldolase/(4S)-4-hydroxy-2-oxoglutarate aldolase